MSLQENSITRTGKNTVYLTLLHSERPKLYGVLAFLRAIGLMNRLKKQRPDCSKVACPKSVQCLV